MMVHKRGDFKAALTCIKTSPNRFFPLHLVILNLISSSIFKPIPQTLSYGLASANTLPLVDKRYVLSSAF